MLLPHNPPYFTSRGDLGDLQFPDTGNFGEISVFLDLEGDAGNPIAIVYQAVAYPIASSRETAAFWLTEQGYPNLAESYFNLSTMAFCAAGVTGSD